VIARRPRDVASLIGDFIRLERDMLGRSLPGILPAQLVPAAGPYTITFGREGVEANDLEDLMLLKLVALLQPERIFEIGTHTGTGTSLLASQAPKASVFTLDLPLDAAIPAHATDPHVIARTREQLGRKFGGTALEPRITQLFGDSAQFDFSAYRRSMDLVYVDGSHSREYVVSDTHRAIEMLRPGGVLLWDDYGSVRSDYGTTRYLEELRQRGYPVYRLGPAKRRACLRARAVMRVSDEILARFAVEEVGRS
jgi:hypothetical protein